MIVVVVWSSWELLEQARQEAQQLDKVDEDDEAGEQAVVEETLKSAEEVAQTKSPDWEKRGSAPGERMNGVRLLKRRRHRSPPEPQLEEISEE